VDLRRTCLEVGLLILTETESVIATEIVSGREIGIGTETGKGKGNVPPGPAIRPEIESHHEKEWKGEKKSPQGKKILNSINS